MNHTHLEEIMAAEGAANAYGRLSGQSEWGEALTRLIPAHMHFAIVRWILSGVNYSQFVEAIVTNDLKNSFRSADDTNRESIWSYVKFFYNYAPIPCWGSWDQAKSWARQGGLLEIVTESVEGGDA